MEEELTGKDYFTVPLTKLVKHPDFSPHAMRVVMAISEMTSAKLEDIDLIGGN